MNPAAEARHWLLHSLELCTASVGAAGWDLPGVEGLRPLRPVKVYAEAALLSRCTGLVVDPTDSPLVAADEQLRQRIADALDIDKARLMVAVDPGTFVDQVFPFALLGTRDERLRAVAQDLHTLVDGVDSGDEPSAFDRLERRWLRAMAYDESPAPTTICGSVLSRGADLLHGDLTAAYSFTHAIAHATDLGTRRASYGRPLGALIDEADALLGQALAAENHDVAAELLWTWPMTGTPFSPSAAFVLDTLAARHAEHGFLPGPEHDPAVHSRVGDDHLIQSSYHTGIVWGVLATGLLAGASCMLADVSSYADPMPLLHRADGSWADRLRALPVRERAACTPLVLGAELRLCVARRDLVGVRRVLAWAAAYGWSELPSVQQASDLLARVVHASQATGVGS
ncbi:DUF6895 family protein [Nocardioides sp. Root140]|uniref:DUF6895 family protein n=1 Tax=Nocardioides sp. Root140 TaxID=1736460 RepID=UPI000AC9171F|nr:hypothetical protein [Nocardioides sp. Root140]